MISADHYENAKSALTDLERSAEGNNDVIRRAMKGVLARECLTANTMAAEKLCKVHDRLIRLRYDEETAGF